MNFEQLWAPWRIGYIAGKEKSAAPVEIPRRLAWLSEADSSCFICRAVAEIAEPPEQQREIDRQNLVVARTKLAVIMLNRYPYNNGHLLIAPLRHTPNLVTLEANEHLELMQTAARFCETLERQMNCEGFNIGLNLGKIAGAGLPGHVHWHLVPRWNGDTNFMPVMAGVNVIPQSLDALWELLYDDASNTVRDNSETSPSPSGRGLG